MSSYELVDVAVACEVGAFVGADGAEEGVVARVGCAACAGALAAC